MTPDALKLNEVPEHNKTVLYESESARVTRVQSADGIGSIIYKERFGENPVTRVRHEQRILELLAKVPGVPRLARKISNLSANNPPTNNLPANMLALEDQDCLTLETAFKTLMSTEALTTFALQVTRVLQGVHQAGVIHKDINPSNLLVKKDSLEPILIDFDLSTTFAEERPAFVHHREIVGTLPFLAPEQTGRMGRSVDHRADLYSLGATLYELACGQPIFRGDDPLQMIHDILAQEPVAPNELNPDLAPALSAIIMRLLHKEPDRRYQSADGLLSDLMHLSQRLASHDGSVFELGINDFPTRISPPSRLIGRETEIGVLKSALVDAIASSKRGLLITGPAGVGKTALVNELRPVVTERRGWFISGKFDQYHESADGGPIVQVMRTLIHLLVLESKADFEAQRARLLNALGRNARLMAAFDPQMANLMGVEPETIHGDPLTVGVRKRQAALDLIRALAGPERPVVIVLDDLQWSDASSLTFLNTLLTDPGMRGLLLIGAYRETALDETHPLSAMITRWQQLKAIPEPLRLANLSSASLTTLLAEMLRLSPEVAAPLSEVIAEHTTGNPYDTVELLNALRQDRILTPITNGWQWNTNPIRQYVGAATVLDFLAARIARLPKPAQTLLEAMACLGRDTSMALLSAAMDCSEQALEALMLPSLEAGLLVLEQDLVEFKHDRVQQAAYNRLNETNRFELQWLLARRLARFSAFASKAAELYFSTVHDHDVHTPAERLRVIDLFEHMAKKLYSLLNYARAEQYLSKALALMDSLDIDPANAQRLAMEKLRHTVLYTLGRLDEADAVYQRIIECRNNTAIDLNDVSCVQISSLITQCRPAEALTLGFTELAKLGIKIADNPSQREAEINDRFELFYRWLENLESCDETSCPECNDERVVAVGRLIDIMIPAALFTADVPVLGWLVLESWRLWIKYGPCAALVGPTSHASFATAIFKEDYRSGYQAVRHVLKVATSRQYKNEYPRALFVYAIASCYWFEPVHKCLSASQRACEDLLQEGNVLSAGFAFLTSVTLLLECAPRLEICAAEADQAISMVERTGNAHLLPVFTAYRYVIQTLICQKKGEGDGDTSEQADCNWAELSKAAQHSPNTAALIHFYRALLGTILGDVSLQLEHSAALMALRSYIQPNFNMMLTYLLRALALAALIRRTPKDAGKSILAEFKSCRAWLAQRAEEAPQNFLYMLHWVDAEYAAAQGDFQQAMIAFDKVMKDDAESLQGFYKPLITERAGLLYKELGAHHMSLALLKRARDGYEHWGAMAKAQQLEQAYGLESSSLLRAQQSTPKRRSSVSVDSDSIDMLAILRASQMLSSETNLARLEAKVVELLGSLTGATKVLLLLPDDETGIWMLQQSATGADRTQTIRVKEAGEAGLLPFSAFQFVLHSQLPLLIKDATQDKRFIDDPYFSELKYCSLMVAPIFSHGKLRAMLLLENHLSRGVFQASVLDTVSLITGQLAVSLENARLYTSLENKVTERTEALEQANRRLEALSITDELTGLANRRRFSEMVESEWLRAIRENNPLSMALIDIDQFKQYNDHYGHQQGDTCLREVAQSLNRSVRKGCDIVARYGGEEFVAVLPNTGLTGALVVAERLRATVEALRLPHQQSEWGYVTISIGIATVIPNKELKVADLIEGADNALYLAKEKGRNRVETNDPEVF